MSDPQLLNFTSYGDMTDTPLLIAHGLFGSARNWRAIARHLSKDRPVVTVDLRNLKNLKLKKSQFIFNRISSIFQA